MRRLPLAALVVALSAALSGSASGQTVGVRASGGYSTATVQPDGVSFSVSLGDAVGVGVGVFAEVPVSRSVAVVVDLGYAQGGAGGEVVQTSPDNPEPGFGRDDYLFRTHVATVAPALSFTLRAEDTEPSLFVGPRLDLKLAERARADGQSGPGDDFPDTAIGLAAGTGVAAGRLRVGLRASYLWGVDSNVRQTAFDLRLGVTL